MSISTKSINQRIRELRDELRRKKAAALSAKKRLAKATAETNRLEAEYNEAENQVTVVETEIERWEA